MKIDSFANRLKQAMNNKRMKQIELANKTKIDKSLINKYIKGIAEAGNDNLPTIAEILGVSEVWLMGYDVPIDFDKNISQSIEQLTTDETDFIDKYKALFDKDPRLTPEQKDFFLDMIENQHRKFDEAQEKGNVN